MLISKLFSSFAEKVYGDLTEFLCNFARPLKFRCKEFLPLLDLKGLYEELLREESIPLWRGLRLSGLNLSTAESA